MKPFVLLDSRTDLLARKVSVAGKLFKFTCREFHCVESHDEFMCSENSGSHSRIHYCGFSVSIVCVPLPVLFGSAYSTALQAAKCNLPVDSSAADCRETEL